MLQDLMKFIIEADTIYQYIGVFIVSLIPFLNRMWPFRLALY